MILIIIFISVLSCIALRLTLKSKYNRKLKMMMLFGSGGHTSEMLLTFQHYNFIERSQQLYFVHSTSDVQEPARVQAFINNNNIKLCPHQWLTIPRSRKVKQSYFSSIFTTIKAIIMTFLMLLKFRDIDLFVTNGPGTCIPIVLCLKIQYWLFLRKHCKILFIESWCRVYALSLSGKLVHWLTDRFVVNWEQLASKSAIYYGNLI